jgi:hypothetical protein
MLILLLTLVFQAEWLEQRGYRRAEAEKGNSVVT